AVAHLVEVVAPDEAVRREPALLGGPERLLQRREGAGVVGAGEEDEGEEEVGGVEGVSVEGLDEGTAPLAPSARHDGLVDPVARLDPALPWGGERTLVGQAESAVEGDPAHQLGVDELVAQAA